MGRIKLEVHSMILSKMNKQSLRNKFTWSCWALKDLEILKLESKTCRDYVRSKIRGHGSEFVQILF